MKKCLFCGNLIDISKDYRNKYCNKSCARQHQYEKKKKSYIKRWKEGLESGNKGKKYIGIFGYVRTYIVEQANYKCSQCGWNEVNLFTGKIPLEIDHIDGDWKNSSIENLRVLCPNCHSLTKTFRGANTGKGHSSRLHYN